MSAMAEMLALRIGLVFGVDSHSSGNSVRWAGDNNWPVKCKLRDGVVAAIVHGYRGYSTLALNQGVCKVPSFNRVIRVLRRLWLRQDQGLSDDDRCATKAAIAGPLAPGFLSPRRQNRDLKYAA